MNKKKFKIIISLFFVFTSVFSTPIYVEAKNTNKCEYIEIASVQNMAKKNKKTTKKTKTSSCEDAPLGCVDDEDSVAWLLQKVLNYMKILGPSIAIVMGSLDFAKAIISSDEDSMKKAQTKFVQRLLAAVVLFFIPLLVEVLLGIFGFTATQATSGLK